MKAKKRTKREAGAVAVVQQQGDWLQQAQMCGSRGLGDSPAWHRAVDMGLGCARQ